MFIVNHRNPPLPPIKQQLKQNKMTPIEKLFKSWLEKEYISPNEWSEAIELEKEHLIYAYNFQKERPSVNLTAEQYYYETFKQQEQ